MNETDMPDPAKKQPEEQTIPEWLEDWNRRDKENE